MSKRLYGSFPRGRYFGPSGPSLGAREKEVTLFVKRISADREGEAVAL